MTVEIKITLDSALGYMGAQLDERLAALGFVRSALGVTTRDAELFGAGPTDPTLASPYATQPATASPRVYSVNEQIVNGETYGGKGPAEIFPREPVVLATEGEKPKRVRRTRAQIAADEAAKEALVQAAEEKIAAIAGNATQTLKAMSDIVTSVAAKATFIKAGSLFGDPAPAISTGESRIDPQDAADEARESAANKTGLTKDDVREAMNRYRTRHGMVDAVADIPKLLGCTIDKLSDDEDILQAAITLIDDAAMAKPSLQERDEAARRVDVQLKDEPGIATKEDVMAALRLYADTYDGKTAEMREAKNLLADVPKVLQKTFGDKCVAITMIPADGYGKAVAAIKDAIVANPFKRTAV